MKSNRLLIGLLALLILFSGATGFAMQRYDAQHTAIRSGLLLPMGALLADNAKTIAALKEAPYAEGNADIMQSFLIKLRRDGVAKSAAMKTLIDRVTENNMSVLALAHAYEAQVPSPEFHQDVSSFERYGIEWVGRWNGVLDLFMAGGNYSAAEPQMPAGFVETLKRETGAP